MGVYDVAGDKIGAWRLNYDSAAEVSAGQSGLNAPSGRPPDQVLHVCAVALCGRGLHGEPLRAFVVPNFACASLRRLRHESCGPHKDRV